MSHGTGAAGEGRASARVAAIDIGTNTVLLLVAELSAEGELRAVSERATITRLGQGVDRTRRLDADAVERTLASLAQYARELADTGVTRLAVVGTSALRDAEGGQGFLDAAERLLGERPRVISGAAEADLTFEGALSGLALQGPVSVFDIGGGSTEIITGTASASPLVERAVSLDVGSVRLTERHVRADPPSASELERVVADVTGALRAAPRPAPEATLVGVAGTVTTLAAIELGLAAYDPSRVHGHRMSREALLAVADRVATLDLAARQHLAGLEPKRADVIVAGAEIARQVLLWSGKAQLVVSDRGVRWGLAHRLSSGRPIPT